MTNQTNPGKQQQAQTPVLAGVQAEQTAELRREDPMPILSRPE
jgi:hypothetical protein